jgi:HEPN domain-containing protein
VKAVLIAHGFEPPRTHSIERLLACLPSDAPETGKLAPLARFTPYGTAYRYPAEEEDAGVPLSAVELAGWIAEIESMAAEVAAKSG